MEKFIDLKSTAIPLPIEDIDTDQIIPARFLKATTRAGFGENLFRDWRYNREGQINNQFVLNNPIYHGKILVSGKNFGCGSSREHAAWALYDYGFRVVVSSFFADIFKNNALNNGLLPITVTPEKLHQIFSLIENDPNTNFSINLASQTFSQPKSGIEISFDIDPFKKMCLTKGMDTIDYLISQKESITQFEANHKIY